MSTPSKPRTFTLTPGGGQQPDPERPGKVTWPHCVHLHIFGRSQVAALVRAGVDYLSRADAGEELFAWSTMGEIVEHREETEQERPVPDAPWPEPGSEG